jgi:hypothetical protein
MPRNKNDIPPPPSPPLVGTIHLTQRLSHLHRIPFSTARPVAAWLLRQHDDTPNTWPTLLVPYRAFCPTPATLLRLITFFDPLDFSKSGDTPLLAHLRNGWKRGHAPAPWFAPRGYEAHSAHHVLPKEAPILHYAREGWARGLDPDPHHTCDLSLIRDRSLLIQANTKTESTAVLAWLAKHLEHVEAALDGPELILLDTGEGYETARAVAEHFGPVLYKARLRLVAADPNADSETLADLVRTEASKPHLMILPPVLPAQVPAPLSAPPAHRLSRRAQLRLGKISPRITIRCPAPNMALAPRWGDFHFAESLAAALKRAGAHPRIVLAEHWLEEEDPTPDATLLLRGVRRRRPKPGPVNLMWILSHPDSVELDELARYDHIFVASQSYARQLKTSLGNRISALMQCSDPYRFAPDAEPRDTENSIPTNRLLFVGNSRRTERWIVTSALTAGHPLSIYGAEWEDTPAAAHVIAENLPNEQLGSYYRRADITLNDHWPDMAARGFVSNRLFDIAMARGFPISDHFAGSEMFLGLLPQVRDTAALSRVIRYFAEHPDERARRATALHALVRHRHTFDARATVILARLRQLF